MGNVTDLPLRESSSPRVYGVPENFTLSMPSFWQWVKAGMGFTVGAIAVTVIAWVTYFVVLLGGLAVIGSAMAASSLRQPHATTAPARR